jgi:hypothetical protein
MGKSAGWGPMQDFVDKLRNALVKRRDRRPTAGEGLATWRGRAATTIGVSILGAQLDLKRLELLHEFVPQARRIAVQGSGRIHSEAISDGTAVRLDLKLVIFTAGDTDEVAAHSMASQPTMSTPSTSLPRRCSTAHAGL